MINTDKIPTPLRNVLEYEYDNRITLTKSVLFRIVKTGIAIECIGMPGLGKTTLFRNLFNSIELQNKIFLPEPSEYAVKVLGLEIGDLSFKNFLNKVYDQFEKYTIDYNPKLKMQEPSRIQNDMYNLIQENEMEIMPELQILNNHFEEGKWSFVEEDKISKWVKSTSSYYQINNNVLYIYLTTQNHYENIILSIERQKSKNRDQKLTTSSIKKLVAYSIAFEQIAKSVPNEQLLILDPKSETSRQVESILSWINA